MCKWSSPARLSLFSASGLEGTHHNATGFLQKLCLQDMPGCY